MSSRVTLEIVVGSALALVLPAQAHAQATAPSSITPSTLRPEQTTGGVQIAIPETGGLTAPAGAENLSVQLDKVVVEGGFPEVAAATDQIIAGLRGRRVSLAEIYRAASEIEAAHARAGFVLARATVPPQSLNDGGTLRIVMIDGFIEAIDTSAVPGRVRRTVARRLAGLEGRRHITLQQIEQPLLIAGEVPGLTMRSTLVRGTQSGGTRLVINATQKFVAGSVGVNNGLAASLGRWSANAQLSLNGTLGLGEQLYGFVSGGYDVPRTFAGDAPVRVLGGGVVLPFGDGRLTINPEVTFARTQPGATALSPETRGDLRRLTLRAGYTLVRTRTRALTVDATLEQIDETNVVTAFGVGISHDRFMAARLGGTYFVSDRNNTNLALTAHLSQGLGSLGAISPADAIASGTPYSRQGSAPTFTKLAVEVDGSRPLGRQLVLRLTVRAQTGFGAALFRSEQFSLEGADALSGFVGGVLSVDDGVSARSELVRQIPIAGLGSHSQIAPYIFVAGGLGRLAQPTIVERRHLDAASIGVGARADLAGSASGFGVSAGVEYARNFANAANFGRADRVNATLTLHF